MTPEERRKRMEERLAAMSPEERAQFEARMKERGFGRGAGGQGGQAGQGGGRGSGPGGNQAPTANDPGNRSNATARRDASRGVVNTTAPGAAVASGHTTIDSLFAPIQFRETPGRVWLFVNKQLKSVRVRTGVADSTFSELVDPGELKEGEEVVVNLVTGLEPRNTPGQQGTGNPLMGPQRGGPGGNRGGGGGRGF
jgi:hypothetical protein